MLATGSPSSRAASCSSWTPSGAASPTTPSGVSYAPNRDQYTVRWDTPSGFAGTCRLLTVRFDDGTEVIARFKFTN